MTALQAPPAQRSRAQRLAAPGTALAGSALATAALHLRDPHVQGSWGLCPSAALGIACPGCGGLRAVNDLTHLDVAAAASSNLLLVVALPLAVLALAVWTLDRWRGRTRDLSWVRLRVPVQAAALVVAAFTVARNLPVGAWLAP